MGTDDSSRAVGEMMQFLPLDDAVYVQPEEIRRAPVSID